MHNQEKNNPGRTIIVVDEDPHARFRFQELVSGWGCLALACPDISSALKALESGINAGVALIGTDMEDADQSHLLALLRKQAPGLPVVLCSSEMKIGTFLKATSLGVFECLEKTAPLGELRRVIMKALDTTDPQVPGQGKTREIIPGDPGQQHNVRSTSN